MYIFFDDLGVVVYSMLTLNERSEILIQKYEKSLALVLVLKIMEVLVLVLVLTTKSSLHHWQKQTESKAGTELSTQRQTVPILNFINFSQ